MDSRLNFLKFSNHFDQVYVLTIASAKERHQSLKEEFGDWDLKIIYGVDKNDIDIDDLQTKGIIDFEKNRRIDPNSKYTKGLICASWGHRMIYDDMLKNGYENVLILEDDALVVNNYPFDLSEVIKRIPENSDLIYWGWLGGVHQSIYQKFILRKSLHILKKILGKYKKFDNDNFEGLVATPFNKYFDKAGKHGGAHAYSINKRTAKLFLDMQTPIVFHPDRIFTYAIKNKIINAYIAIPPVLTEASYSGSLKVLPSMLDYHEQLNFQDQI